MSKNVVKDFLAEVKEQKIKQMLGIKLDQKYWAEVIGTADIEDLRKELVVEKEKIIKNRNGTIHQDNRNMDKIARLNEEIDNLEKAVKELARLGHMEKGIIAYMVFVDKPTKEALEELEKIAKL